MRAVLVLLVLAGMQACAWLISCLQEKAVASAAAHTTQWVADASIAAGQVARRSAATCVVGWVGCACFVRAQGAAWQRGVESGRLRRRQCNSWHIVSWHSLVFLLVLCGLVLCGHGVQVQAKSA